MTVDQLAARTGIATERIVELTERGVLTPVAPGRYAPGDVHRVRVIAAFETAGITIDALVAAADEGRVTFAYYDELHQEPGPISTRTYAQFAASLGRLGERLPSLFAAFGLAEPPPTARLEADQEPSSLRSSRPSTRPSSPRSPSGSLGCTARPPGVPRRRRSGCTKTSWPSSAGMSPSPVSHPRRSTRGYSDHGLGSPGRSRR